MKLRTTSDKWQGRIRALPAFFSLSPLGRGEGVGGCAQWQVTSDVRNTRGANSGRVSRFPFHSPAFTLVELILVLALLVIITSLVAPAMSNFVRGRALDSEARRLMALMHAGQSRAVSEGMPMMLWLDEKQGAYGLEAETPPKGGDPKAETLPLDGLLQITVVNTGSSARATFKNLPAIRFQADGTVDETSPPTLRLMDAAGRALWLVEARNHMGYEIRDTEK